MLRYFCGGGAIVKQCIDKCAKDSSVSSQARDLLNAYERCTSFRCLEGDCRTIVSLSLMTTDETTYIDGDFFSPLPDFNISQMRTIFSDPVRLYFCV
jgi:hypothetical protein